MAEFILRNVNNSSENNEKSIITATSKLIQEQVRQMKSSEYYATYSEVCDDKETNAWIPDLLQHFMHMLYHRLCKDLV